MTGTSGKERGPIQSADDIDRPMQNATSRVAFKRKKRAALLDASTGSSGRVDGWRATFPTGFRLMIRSFCSFAVENMSMATTEWFKQFP